jgi:Leucine-rich repeat (LRR) protein
LLPDEVFSGLESLKILDLTNSQMRRLPKSMHTLPKIEVVYFYGNGLSTVAVWADGYVAAQAVLEREDS